MTSIRGRVVMTCCSEFAAATAHYRGMTNRLYPGDLPTGQIEEAPDGTWNVNGCCGGGCHVLEEINFCPFCGSKLSEPGT